VFKTSAAGGAARCFQHRQAPLRRVFIIPPLYRTGGTLPIFLMSFGDMLSEKNAREESQRATFSRRLSSKILLKIWLATPLVLGQWFFCAVFLSGFAVASKKGGSPAPAMQCAGIKPAE